MGDTYDQDKRLIRGRLQASRSQLSAGEVARLSARACARLLASPIFARARHLAAYAAADNELDPALLIEAALAAGKNLYLPVTSRERFEFVTVPAARPGAEAGLPPGGPCLPPEVEDVVFLVPGVAFGSRSSRAGRRPRRCASSRRRARKATRSARRHGARWRTSSVAPRRTRNARRGIIGAS